MEGNNNQLIKHNDQLQMMPLEEAKHWYNEFVSFSKSILKNDIDYGVIPGTPKPSLLKPGAEKLRFAYGLSTEFETIEKTVDLSIPFVDYTYKCTVKSRSGQILAQCEGNCNSVEAKFGFLWLGASELPEGIDISKLRTKTSGKKLMEFEFAIEKKETGGQYGKPAEYWDKWLRAIDEGTARPIQKETKKGKRMAAWEIDEQVTLYRVPNPDVVGLKNTIMKMAQKRAFVGAMLLATGASEFFTQDIEDMEINGQVYTNEKASDITDAEVISETPAAATAGPASSPNSDAPEEERLPSHWYAKLDKCKSPEAVDELAQKHQETIAPWPALRKAFTDRKKALRLESANHQTA